MLADVFFTDFFDKFGTLTAKVIFKAEFVCDRKRKYFARMRGKRVSVLFLRYIQYLTTRKNGTLLHFLCSATTQAKAPAPDKWLGYLTYQSADTAAG